MDSKTLVQYYFFANNLEASYFRSDRLISVVQLQGEKKKNVKVTNYSTELTRFSSFVFDVLSVVNP